MNMNTCYNYTKKPRKKTLCSGLCKKKIKCIAQTTTCLFSEIFGVQLQHLLMFIVKKIRFF
jgi:hypothetical protein